MRYYRTTGLTLTQMQELVRRVNEALDEPWNKRTGRPKSLGLHKAVEAACMYLRQNATQEFIGETRDTSQPTISRYAAVLVPLVQCRLACTDQVLGLGRLQVGESDRGRPVVADGLVAWLLGGVSDGSPAFYHAGTGAVADGVEVPFPGHLGHRAG